MGQIKILPIQISSRLLFYRLFPSPRKRPGSLDSYIFVFVIYYQGSEYQVDTSMLPLYCHKYFHQAI